PELDAPRRRRAGLRRAGRPVAVAVAGRAAQAAGRPHRRTQAAAATGPRGRSGHPARPVEARGVSLRALWDARGVAVVGASDRAGAVGRLPVQYLQRYGYAGGIYPVRPDGAPVAGLPSYASVGDVPGPVDLAMVMVAADRVVGAVRDCAGAGVPVGVACSSGFAETGPDGAARQDELVATARELGVRVLGPNCIGTVGTSNGQVSSFSPLFAGEHTELVPGG